MITDNCTSIKQVQVNESLSYLLDRIELATSKLNELETRLEPVRLIRPNGCDKSAEKQKEQCKLAKTITDYGDKVNFLSNRIGEILTELEI
jgi:hypothetical protein